MAKKTKPVTPACCHVNCPPNICVRADKFKAEVERITAANTPKVKPELGPDVVGNMNGGRFVQHQVRLRQQIHGLSEEMIAIVADLARNSISDFCRLAAANSLLDRDLGKAVQFTEQTLREERVIKVETLTPALRADMVKILDALDPDRKTPDKIP